MAAPSNPPSSGGYGPFRVSGAHRAPRPDHETQRPPHNGRRRDRRLSTGSRLHPATAVLAACAVGALLALTGMLLGGLAPTPSSGPPHLPRGLFHSAPRTTRSPRSTSPPTPRPCLPVGPTPQPDTALGASSRSPDRGDHCPLHRRAAGPQGRRVVTYTVEAENGLDPLLRRRRRLRPRRGRDPGRPSRLDQRRTSRCAASTPAPRTSGSA